jgi:hypothetical protein
MVKRLVWSFLLLFCVAVSQPTISFAHPSTARLAGCASGELGFNGAKRESPILNDTDLLSQPRFGNTANPMVLVTIPKDARVIVFDIDNVERKWYRVLWACNDEAYAGWIPVDAVKFYKGNANPKVAPPACVQSKATLDSVKATWKSDFAGRMVVVVDLFRPPDNTKYQSFFYLTSNGSDVHDKDREIRTEGPFLINGEVVNVLKATKSMVVGFHFTKANPAIRLYATIYRVPDGCEWAV